MMVSGDTGMPLDSSYVSKALQQPVLGGGRITPQAITRKRAKASDRLHTHQADRSGLLVVPSENLKSPELTSGESIAAFSTLVLGSTSASGDTQDGNILSVTISGGSSGAKSVER